MEKHRIREKYTDFARWYDIVLWPEEMLIARRYRRRLLRRASGNVLEIAVGTGRNLPYYPKSCRIVAVDLTPAMIEKARSRTNRLGLEVSFAVMDGEALAFPDDSFDTVVDSLTLCTFPDPVAALREMARVCKPGGRILLFEHGRSDRERIGRWQDRRADKHARDLGCHWNREPVELVRQAGLKPLLARRHLFGVFHLMEIAADSGSDPLDGAGVDSAPEPGRRSG